MSSLSRLIEIFPGRSPAALKLALEASKGDVNRAGEFLLSESGSVGSDEIEITRVSPVNPTTRINVAEKRLVHPNFRQPLRPSIAFRHHIKGEPGTERNIKQELVENDQTDLLSLSATKRESNKLFSPGTSDQQIKEETKSGFGFNPLRSRTSPSCPDNVIDVDGVANLGAAWDKPPADNAASLQTLWSIFPAINRRECEKLLEVSDNDVSKAYELIEGLHPTELIEQHPVKEDSVVIRGKNSSHDESMSASDHENPVSRQEAPKIARSEKRRAVPEPDTLVGFL